MSNRNDRYRAMYAGQRGNATARRFARFWNAAIGIGVMPRRWVVLEVPGRSSGRLTRFPVGMADLDGAWYLVSMLGNNCHWVLNVRAAGGVATLRRRKSFPCVLVEVPVADRAAIIKRYLEVAPGGRPHIPVDRKAPLTAFAQIAEEFPAFRVEPRAARVG